MTDDNRNLLNTCEGVLLRALGFGYIEAKSAAEMLAVDLWLEAGDMPTLAELRAMRAQEEEELAAAELARERTLEELRR